MTPRHSYALLGTLLTLVLAAFSLAAGQAPPTYADVAPIFDDRCTLCHSGANAPLGLSLRSYDELMAGSSNGPVVVPGDPEASELIARLEGRSLPRMPLTGPPFLDEEQIGLIRDWILGGALEGEPLGAAGAPADGVGAPAHAPDAPADGPGSPADAADGQEPANTHEADGSYASVETIFLNRCAVCHTENGAMGAPPEGLRLDSHDRAVRGGDRVVVVPGEPLASEMYRRILGLSLPRMPLRGPPLTEAEVARVTAWIREGAKSPEGTPAPLPAGGEVRLGGTLTALWELDGLTLVVGPDTRIDDDPGVGDYVEVRGIVTPDGSIRIERIRTR